MKTKLYSFLTTIIGLTAGLAFAAGVPQKLPTDTLQIGIPGAPVKSVIVNTGDGVNNPAITVDGTVKEFILNKNANLKGNTNTLGDGAATDKVITFDTGDGGSNKKITLKGASKDVELNSNTMKLGDAAASNKVLQFNKGAGSPEIRWNNSTSKLEFSNDGSVYKAIGSGSGAGGGINFLAELNPGFEDGTGSYTATGLAFSTTTTAADVGFELRAGVVNSSATAQTLDSTSVSIPTGLQGKPCVASVWYRTTESTNKYLLQVYDGTNVLSEHTLEARSEYDKDSGYAAFTCPTSGTIRLRIRSTGDSADLFLDQVFLGEQKTIQVGGAFHVGSANTIGAANCTHSQTNTSYDVFPADSDCNVATVTGQVLAPTTKIPGFRLGSLGPAKLKVTTNGSFLKNTAAAYTCAYRLYDGTTASDQTPTSYDGGSNGSQGTHVYYLDYPNGFTSEKTFQIQVKSSTGAACLIANNAVEGENLTFDVEAIPYESSIGIRADAVGKYVEATIAGANIALSSSDQASFIEMTNASLVLTNHGLLPAQIACASGTASTGTTCSVDESNGIAFNVQEAGTWEVCSEFTHESNDTIGQFAFVLDRTSNTSSTSVYEGKKIEGTYYDRTPGAIQAAKAINICGDFDLVVGQATFRAKYKQDITSLTVNQVDASSLGSLTGFKIRWTAKPKNVNRNIPIVFKDMVTSSNSEVAVDTGNGHGSINDKIRRFVNVNKNIGTAITFADSATLGSSFTINEKGIYAITYSDTSSSTSGLGISVNTATPTTTIQGLSYANGKRVLSGTPSYGNALSVILNLEAGDVVRAHTDGSPSGATNDVTFTIVQVAKN